MTRSPTHLGMGKCSTCCKAGVRIAFPPTGVNEEEAYKRGWCWYECESCNRVCDTQPSKHVFDESLNKALDDCIERGLPFCTFCGAPTEEIYVDHVIDKEVGAIAGGHEEIQCTKCGKEQGEEDVQPPAPAESADVEKERAKNPSQHPPSRLPPEGCGPWAVWDKSAEVEKPLYQESIHEERDRLESQRDAAQEMVEKLEDDCEKLQEEIRILRTSANYKMIAEQQKRIDEMEKEQITIMQEQTDTNTRYLEETKKRDRRIAELEEQMQLLQEKYEDAAKGRAGC